MYSDHIQSMIILWIFPYNSDHKEDHIYPTTNNVFNVIIQCI